MKKGGNESFPLGPPSTSCGAKCFEWLVSPHSTNAFVQGYWEKRPLVIKRNSAEYFSGILTRRTIENYLKNDVDFAANSLVFTRGDPNSECSERETISETSVDVDTFKRMIDEDGWTCQVVHPQNRNAKVHALLERLENWSGTLWGSNLYIGTSSSTNSSFTAFSDNVELFVMQLDGECHWKIYEGEQKLSRDSGSEFQEEDLGPSIVDEKLQPGDLVYIPRGYVYSCNAISPFTYLTLSTYQNQAWCDLISTAVSETLEQITKTDVAFREGLPINWTSLFGVTIEETDNNISDRQAFSQNLKSLMHKLIDSINIDDIADQMASDFIALRTPPVVRKRPNSDEELKTFGPDPRTSNDLKMRIRNPAWIRIVVDEEEKILIFSCLDNDISNHMRTDNPMEANPTSLEIDGTKSLAGLRQLVTEWPNWCGLDIISRDVAGELWANGLLETSGEHNDSKKHRNS
jgi:hypothetical protein